jgi:predicted nuclease with RNAse H fold
LKSDIWPAEVQLGVRLLGEKLPFLEKLAYRCIDIQVRLRGHQVVEVTIDSTSALHPV